MYNESSELAKLFLNLEKMLIDFRILQIENNAGFAAQSLKGQCSCGNHEGKNEEELLAKLRGEIRSIVKEELNNLSSPSEPVVGVIKTPEIPMEKIKEKVLENTVKPAKVEEQPIVKKALTKGGTAFKYFEPVSLHNVTKNSSSNSVAYSSSSLETPKIEVLKAALS